MSNSKFELATLGGGCFWCIEAVFNEIKGVEKVVSGYSGGTVPGKPTYREVCSGLTGHAEVIQISFDPTCHQLRRNLDHFYDESRSNNPKSTGCRCRYPI